jgi:hypothetical protein
VAATVRLPKGRRPVTQKISRTKLLLARVVVGLMAAFSRGGLVWYGLPRDSLARAWQDLVDRHGGPMLFRFFLQPTMAIIAGVLGGLHDARLGRTPFMQTVLTRPTERADRVNEAVVDTSRIMLRGLIMDTIYPYIEFVTFPPGEAVILTLFLAFLPYVLLRGLVTRVASGWVGPRDAKGVR